MPVSRYRDVADMPAPPRLEPRDPATFDHIRELWRFASRLPPLFAPGVYRYRSIEESDRAREQALIERMRTVRARSRRDPRMPSPSSQPESPK